MNDVREVYLTNLEEEMEFLVSVVPSVDTVCISCEFGGVVCRPLGQFRSQQDYHYQTMRSNVDLVSPLQIALTVADATGRLNLTWQFNMRFQDVMFQNEIVESLVKTGANIARMAEDGIPPDVLGAQLLDSGLLGKTWVSHHAGYDFGYLLNTLYGETPLGLEGFKARMEQAGGRFVDLKWGPNPAPGPGPAGGVQAGNQSQAALVGYLTVGQTQTPSAGQPTNPIYGFD